jgi:hypothetical protein
MHAHRFDMTNKKLAKGAGPYMHEKDRIPQAASQGAVNIPGAFAEIGSIFQGWRKKTTPLKTYRVMHSRWNQAKPARQKMPICELQALLLPRSGCLPPAYDRLPNGARNIVAMTRTRALGMPGGIQTYKRTMST